MKKAFKKVLSLLLAITIIFSSAVVGIGVVGFSGFFAIKASAVSTSDLTFTYKDGGYYVTGCVKSAYGSLYIPSTYNGEPVIGIGDNAFSQCQNITTVTIPDSVKKIGSYAFYSCYNLKSVSLGDGLEHLNMSVFSNCTSLSSVDFGDSLQSIDYGSFSGCTSLSSITIPDNVTSIGSSAFYGCSKLSSIYLHSNIRDVSGGAFGNCSSLTAIVVDKNNPYYYSINGVLFKKEGAVLLQYPAAKPDAEYVIPDGVKMLERASFSGAKNLGTVTMPSSLYSIEESVFYKCIGLESIKIPEGVTEIWGGAFRDCTNLKFVEFSDTVTTIGSSCFSNCTSLESIEIPESVCFIDGSAFKDCTSLASIKLPETPIAFNYSDVFYNTAYYNDSSNWIDNVLYIGSHLIDAKESIAGKCVVKEGTKTIAAFAFKNCSNLTSIAIPDSIVHIDGDAFYKCDNLNSVYITDLKKWCLINFKNVYSNPLSQADLLFVNDEVATDIVMTEDIVYINDYAFYGYKNLSSVELPESLISVGVGAFYNCTNLSSVNIPDTVTNIGSSAFRGCSRLNNVTISEDLFSENYSAFSGSAYYDNKSIWVDDILYVGSTLVKANTSISGDCVIKPGTKKIENNAFDDCRNLKSVTIPDGVTEIGSSAFAWCFSIKDIIIPDSVVSIGRSAFGSTAYYKDKSNWSDGALYIGNHLIKVDASAENLTIKDGTKTIADYALQGCSNLSVVTLPSSIKTIGSYAFNGCSKLLAVTIPDGVTSIGSYAFSGCNKLDSISLPETLNSIGQYAFNYTGYYRNIDNWENSVLYIGSYLIVSEETIGGDYIIKAGTKVISDYAFMGANLLKSVSMPSSVTSVGSLAFQGCYGLETVTVSGGIKDIFNNSFYTCFKLKYVFCDEEKFPSSIKKIGSSNGWFVNAKWHYGATDHTLSDWIIDKTPTCTEDGFKHKICDVCGDVFEDQVITASGHKEVIDLAVEPTCTTDGKTQGSHCSVCNVVIVAQQAVSSKGHSYSSKVTTPATHLTTGVMTYTCHCGDSYTEVIPKITEHSYKTTQTAPTCTEKGYTIYTCECGHSYVADYINAKGHTEVTDNAITPTCIVVGKTEGTHCSVCGVVIVAQQTIPAKGHSHTATVTKPATHLTTGIMTYTCHCGDAYTEVIPKTTEHNFESTITAPTCTEKGYTTYTCECGESYVADYVNAKGHTASEWLVEKHATCTEDGSKNKKCITCGVVVETAMIFATGHNPSEWKYNVETRTEYKDCTECKEVLESRKIPLPTTKITSCYNEVKGVQLKWTAVTDASEYQVYRKLANQSNWVLITTTSELAYQDTDVVGNTIYQYRIKAVDQYGNESEFSAQKECRFIETPTLLTRENAVGGVKITWEKVAGATSYRIYRRGAGTDYWFYLGDFPATLDTFTDYETANYFPENPSKNQQAKPKSGNYYRYTVRASYDGKDSSGKDYLIYSGFDTNGLYLKYVATPKLTSISNATGGLQIKWNAVNGGGDTEYRVYRRGAGSTYWKYLGTTTSTTWTDAEVKNANGGYYRYTVRAVAGKNGSGWYSAFDTTGLYLMRLANPTLKSAVSSSAGITVKWSSVKGATSYYVYRKTASSGWTRIATVNGNANTTYLDKTAKKGVTYTYTVRAVFGKTTSYFNSGISCKDKY